MDADLAVIGGGPVGLAVAIEARLAGLEVVVVEPRTAPIDKACGEGLMPGALRALLRLGIDPEGWPLHGITYVAGERRAEHPFAVSPGRGVRRTTLHGALADRAAALGTRLVRGRITTIAQDGHGVALSGSGLDEIRTPWAVAADGLHSRARRSLGAEAPARAGRGRRFGLRRHFAVAPWSDHVEVHWSDPRSAARFEAYVTPVGSGEVGVALLGPPGLDFDTALERLPELADHVAGASRGGVIGAGPLRQRARRRVVGRVLLAGDASGYVDALTGEGLRVGLEHARASVDAIVAGEPARYGRQWRRVTRDYRMLTGGLVAVARSPLRSRIVPAAERLPRFYGAIVERLAR